MANLSAVMTVATLLTRRGESSGKDWLSPYRGCLLHGNSAGCGKTMTIREIRWICEQDPSIAVFEIAAGDMHLYQTGELEYELLCFCEPKLKSSEVSTRIVLADDIDIWFEYKSVQSILLSSLSESEAGSLFVVCSCSNLERVPARLLLPGNSLLMKVDIPLPGRNERAALLRDLLMGVSVDSPVDSVVDELVAMTQGFSSGDIHNIIRDAVLSCNASESTDTAISSVTLRSFATEIASTINTATSSLFACEVLDEESVLIGDQYKCLLDKLRHGILDPYLRALDDPSAKTFGGYSGIILQGPSGVGKTSLARRFAYECRQHFKLITVSCSDLVHKVIGDSERRISELFATARKVAPTLILLENIDIMLGNLSSKKEKVVSKNNGEKGGQNIKAEFTFPRSRTSDKTIDRFLSAFLIEMDGILSNSSNEKSGKLDSANFDSMLKALKPVVVIATTYDLETLDASLLRPGRLEEHLILTIPDTASRQKIILNCLDKIHFTDVIKGSIEYDALIEVIVSSTEGWNPASIKRVFEEASISAIRSLILSGSMSSMSTLFADDNDDESANNTKSLCMHSDCLLSVLSVEMRNKREA